MPQKSKRAGPLPENIEQLLLADINKTTKRSLLQAENRLRDIIAIIPDVVWTMNHRSRAVFMSANLISMCGYRPMEFCLPSTISWFSVVHRDDLARLKKSLRLLFSKNQKFDIEYRVRRKDGQWIWVRDQAVAIYKKGGQLFADGVLSDITQNKEAEVAVSTQKEVEDLLRSSEEQLRLITDNLPVLIGYVDTHECYRFNNKTHKDWFGLDTAQMSGKTIREIVGEAAYESIKGYIRTVLAGCQVTFESSIPFAHGGVRHVRMTYIPHVAEGSIKGFFSLVTDITQAKQAEMLRAEVMERKRIDKLKDELIGTVSHEVRTPLAVIKNVVDDVQRGIAGTLTEPQKKYIEIAKRNIDRLARVVTNLLDLSRLESGVFRYLPQRVNLQPLVLEAVDNFQIVSRAQNIDLKLELSEGSTDCYVDTGLITQVLSNLLDNAMRFSKRNIILKVVPRADFIQVSVIDDGRGIAKADIEKLFKRFVQVERAQEGQEYKGTGLGLAICKEIIDIHHGKIWVESEKDHGAQFHFTLPVPKPRAAATTTGL